MSLAVFWHQPKPAPVPDALVDRLDPGVELECGADPPSDAQFEVLIGVSPPRDLFVASPRLHTFVISQAGFTVKAREAMDGLDHLAVHNLHHNSTACAETAVALMLACVKRTCEADRDLREGRWTTRYDAAPQAVLRGRTAVILGFGEIGCRIAPVCEALGMDVIGVRRRSPDDRQSNTAETELDLVGVERLHDVLPRADVLLMALPATEATDHLIGADELDLVPPHCVVVNVGRAGQIDEVELYARLRDGRLGGAGLDVWRIEPTIEQADLVMMPSELAFHELDNVVMSPHKAGWLPHDDAGKWVELAEVLNCLARGEPAPNSVDVRAGY